MHVDGALLHTKTKTPCKNKPNRQKIFNIYTQNLDFDLEEKRPDSCDGAGLILRTAPMFQTRFQDKRGNLCETASPESQ